MRDATIDLDWLDGFISDREIVNLVVSEDLSDSINLLKEIRSKCTPIEPPVFLSKTCINSWPNSSYCANEGKCILCSLK